MTMTDPQPRTATGQFSEKEGSAPEIGLNEFGDASFEYPPARYTDAAQVVRFWENVQVPSSALDAMRVSYNIARNEYETGGGDEAVTNLYETEDWQVQQERDPAAFMNKVSSTREAGISQAQGEWLESHAPEIPRHQAREIARGLQMWYYAPLAGDAERDKVWNHSISIGGEQVTVNELRARYAFCDGLGFDASAFEPYDNRILAELGQLREDLREYRDTEDFTQYMNDRADRQAERDALTTRGRR